MTVEREVIIKTLRAARKANEAAVFALGAVEKMLLEPEATPLADDAEPAEETPKTCDHADAIPVQTTDGSYLVCHCGEQIKS